MALDQVIDQYDPYRLSTHNNNIGELKSQPPAYQEDDKDSNDSRNEEIRKSIEALDSVLDAYDDDASLENSDSTKRSSQVSMRSQAQKSPQSKYLPHGGGHLYGWKLSRNDCIAYRRHYLGNIDHWVY